jgi:hypothetical protein
MWCRHIDDLLIVVHHQKFLPDDAEIFSWFVTNIEAFDSNEVGAACRYLGVPASQEINETLAQFRRPSAHRSAG